MTFEAVLDENIPLLRDSIAAISEVIDEAELHIKEKGIEMLSADRAVVVVVSFVLSRNAFQEYKHNTDARIGINLLHLLQILRRAKPDDRMKIKLEENKLLTVLEGESVRRFVLPLIDISKTEPPDTERLEAGFSSLLNINSDVLSSGIEDAELVADSIIFTVQKDRFTMNAESDASSTHLEIDPEKGGLKILNINEPVRSRYSLDYLKKIIKAKKLSDIASISMATDYPVKIQFAVPDKMKLSFILAPRVED